MEKLKGGNPYENLSKKSFQEAKIIDENNENTDIDLQEPIYRVVTGSYILADIRKDFHRVVDTRYLFTPSKFPSLHTQLELDTSIELENVMYGDSVDNQSYFTDQMIAQKQKAFDIISYTSKTLH